MNELQTYEAVAGPGIRDLFAVLRRRKRIIAAFFFTSLLGGIAFGIFVPKVWESSATLMLVERPTVLATPGTYQAPTASVESQLSLLQSGGMYDRIRDWLRNYSIERKQTIPEEELDSTWLSGHIEANDAKFSNVITVTARAHSRDDAILLATATIQAFTAWDKELAQADVQRTVDSLTSRAATARADLEAITKKQTDFRNRVSVVDAPSQQRTLLDQLSNRQIAASDLQQAARSEIARLNVLGQELAKANKAIAAGQGVRDDTLVQSLQTQLTQAETDRVDAATKYTAAYPGGLQPFDQKIADLKARLNKAIKSTVGGGAGTLQQQSALYDQYQQQQAQVAFAQAKLQSATSSVSQLKAQLAKMPNVSMTDTQLAQDVALATSTYTSCQNALNDARLQRDKINGTVQVAASATAGYLPSRPNLPISIIAGIAIGLALSAFAAGWAEQADRRLYSRHAVSRTASWSIISEIPLLPKGLSRRIAAGEILPETIAPINLIRANIEVAHRVAQIQNRQRKVLMVTSAVKGEGKSTVAYGLARSYARSGSSVLLVDANLYHPTIPSMLNEGTGPGLADVLSGRNTLGDCIADTKYPSLSVLYAGTPHAVPSELFATKAMTKLMETIRMTAEIVIIDAPAMENTSDAIFLSPYVDAVINVVALGMATEDRFALSSKTLQELQKDVFVVLNRAPRDRNAGYRVPRLDVVLKHREELAAPSDDYANRQALPTGRQLGGSID